MEKVGSYHYVADPGLMNVLRNLQLPRLVEWLLESAGYHATTHNWGYQEMLDRNQGWVLIRFSLEMDAYPQAFDELIIDTWVEDLNKMVSSRNFCIRRADGLVYGYARTTWSLLDLIERRAVDLTTQVSDIQDMVVDKECPIAKQGKLPSVDDTDLHHRYTINYSDLDFNQHTNSCRYVEQIQNCFPLEWYRAHPLRRIDMAFLSEICYGEEIAVCSTTHSDTLHSNIEIKKADGRSACRAMFTWL